MKSLEIITDFFQFEEEKFINKFIQNFIKENWVGFLTKVFKNLPNFKYDVRVKVLELARSFFCLNHHILESLIDEELLVQFSYVLKEADDEILKLVI